MKMQEVARMFHSAFRDSSKRIGFSEFGGTLADPILVARHDQEFARAPTNPILLNCFSRQLTDEPFPLQIEKRR
jgi:hypothetical protein